MIVVMIYRKEFIICGERHNMAVTVWSIAASTTGVSQPGQRDEGREGGRDGEREGGRERGRGGYINWDIIGI